MAARPAPMTLAEARSIWVTPFEKRLVKVDRVVDVQRREDSENIGLDRRDEQLERTDERDEQEAEDRNADPAAAGVEALHDEIAEDVEQNVPREHGDEGTKPEAERPHHERDELDREQQDLGYQGHPGWHEQREEVQPVLPEADTEHDRKADQRHDTRDRELTGHGEGMRHGNDAEG